MIVEERIVPGISSNELVQEHIDRYKFALDYVKGKKVLDAACGSGYGSYMLAQTAYDVVGVDISTEAINHAREHYKACNLEFIKADACKLPFEDNEFDIVVSFETLERLQDSKSFISECRRVLRPNGTFICSTPNAEASAGLNTYHIKEFTAVEFGEMLHPHYKLIEFHGQVTIDPVKNAFGKMCVKIKNKLGIEKRLIYVKNSYPVGMFKNGVEKSTYIIAVCY